MHLSLKHTLSVGVLVLLGFYVPQKVEAVFLFSEVYPNPNTNETEWIELFNNSDTALSLSGWNLWDQESQPSVIYTFSATDTLPPKGYFSFSTKNVLNNAGDSLSLFNASGVLQDFLTYTSSEKGFSWSRDINSETTELFHTNPSYNLPNLLPTPTPTSTPLPTPSPAPSLPPNTLILSEVMACPQSGENEWAELWNLSDQDIPLSGYELFDSTHSIAILDDLTIRAQDYLVVSLKSVLNNTADAVFLINLAKEIIDSFSYTECTVGKSFIRSDDSWIQTDLPTPEKQNIFPAPIQTPSPKENPQPNTHPLTSNLAQTSPEATLSGSTTKSAFQYPTSLLQPELHWSTGSSQLLQSIFFEPPHLERGAISVIMGGLFLLIPGFIYVKKREEFF